MKPKAKSAPLPELCRYDYVVQIVDALTIYLDTCSLETNTQELIRRVQVAAENLAAIEAVIHCKRPSERTRKLSAQVMKIPAMAEFQAIHDKIALIMAKLKNPLAAYAAELHNMRATVEAAREVQKSHLQLRHLFEHMKKTMDRTNTFLTGTYSREKPG